MNKSGYFFNNLNHKHTWNKPLIKDNFNPGRKISEKPNTRSKIDRCLKMLFDLEKFWGKLVEMANHFLQPLHKWSWISTGIQDDHIRSRELNLTTYWFREGRGEKREPGRRRGRGKKSSDREIPSLKGKMSEVTRNFYCSPTKWRKYNNLY